MQALTGLDRLHSLAPRPGSWEVAVGLAPYCHGLPPDDWDPRATASAVVPGGDTGVGQAPVVHLSGLRFVNAGRIFRSHWNVSGHREAAARLWESILSRLR